MTRIVIAALAAALPMTALCQPAPAFEVVSIKPTPPGVVNMGIGRGPGGGLNAYNVPLTFLITFAYDVRDFQVSGAPGWSGLGEVRGARQAGEPRQ